MFKSGPRPAVFNTFGSSQTCFAPQLRTFFEHLNFQKCSDHEVCFQLFWRLFWAFFPSNVLRATTVGNVCSLLRPDGSAPAALATLLLDPPEPRNNKNTQRIAIFLPFRAPWFFYWLFLFWLLFFWHLLFPPLLLCSSILSEDVGSLTSKSHSKLPLSSGCWVCTCLLRQQLNLNRSCPRLDSKLWTTEKGEQKEKEKEKRKESEEERRREVEMDIFPMTRNVCSMLWRWPARRYQKLCKPYTGQTNNPHVQHALGEESRSIEERYVRSAFEIHRWFSAVWGHVSTRCL